MILNEPLFFSLLVALGVMIGFVAVWRIMRPGDAVEERLQQYAAREQQPVSVDTGVYTVRERHAESKLKRLLAGLGLGPRLALALARADLPLTAAEFTLIVLGAGLLGFVLGLVRMGPALGLALALLFGSLPFLYLHSLQRRRQRDFTKQLPDMLTLLVGALRAGYGLSQALEMLVARLAPPVSTEIAYVVRAIRLGVPVPQALCDMSERVGTDDLDLVVTAINVQYETGGNLAQTLDVIAETVRDRLRILREIRALTAEQRFTGYVLALLPVIVALLLFVINPTYIGQLFEPGWVRLLPAGALLMQLLGFLAISRIVDIEV